MKRFSARRPLLALVALLLIVASLLAWSLWREVRHERLSHDLLAAIRREDTATALADLEQGADANARDEPQTLSAWQRLWAHLRRLPPAPSTAPTPLLLALEWKLDAQDNAVYPRENLPLIDALLAQGAQVNVLDEEGWTPLYYSLWSGKNDTIRRLIQQGANVKGIKRDSMFILSPLQYACEFQAIDADVVEMMLQHGADPSRHYGVFGTPLAWAVQNGRPDKVRILLLHHADPNTSLDYYNPPPTCLSYAEKNAASNPDMRQIAQMLRKAGAKK